jgi:hypothetical protein
MGEVEGGKTLTRKNDAEGLGLVYKYGRKSEPRFHAHITMPPIRSLVTNSRSFCPSSVHNTGHKREGIERQYVRRARKVVSRSVQGALLSYIAR